MFENIRRLLQELREECDKTAQQPMQSYPTEIRCALNQVKINSWKSEEMLDDITAFMNTRRSK